jgi:hypothetical protein
VLEIESFGFDQRRGALFEAPVSSVKHLFKQLLDFLDFLLAFDRFIQRPTLSDDMTVILGKLRPGLTAPIVSAFPAGGDYAFFSPTLNFGCRIKDKLGTCLDPFTAVATSQTIPQEVFQSLISADLTHQLVFSTRCHCRTV